VNNQLVPQFVTVRDSACSHAKNIIQKNNVYIDQIRYLLTLETLLHAKEQKVSLASIRIMLNCKRWKLSDLTLLGYSQHSKQSQAIHNVGCVAPRNGKT
jgi:hypothetical protein